MSPSGYAEGSHIHYFRKYLRDDLKMELNTKKETVEVPLEISLVGRVEKYSAQDEEQVEIMKEVPRNSVSMERTMVVTKAQENL